jgi:hypothetical protein
MTPLAAGFIVWLALLLIGRIAGGPLIIGFFTSLPFGSTAFITLHALGGSSPLIYTLFVLALLGGIAARRTVLSDLGAVFAHYKPAWAVVALGAYAAASAYINPRLFAGETTVFIAVLGVVREVPLAPSSGTITQTAYFLLGALLFIGLCSVSLQARNLKKISSGFFAFAITHALLGLLDIGAKLAGLGDILLPIRTASYALLTEAEQSGFWRIVGGFSEASAFSAYALAAMAFSFAYWRRTDSWLAAILTATLFLLLILSTSSTSYVGCGALCLLALAGVGASALRNRLSTADIVLITGALTTLTALLALYLYDSRLFAPFTTLIQTMVFEKAASESGIERAYWNVQSLQSFLDTYGLGTGMGSSRSSSWLVSTISQLGVIGALLVAFLVAALLRGMGGLRAHPEDRPLFALCAGARACGFAFLLASSIAGGMADPGVLFFAALATVLACRHHVMARRRRMQQAERMAAPAFLAGRLA